MGAQPKPRKIKRIGLAIEFEDGGRIMIYADNLNHAEVTVKTETPVVRDLWTDGTYRSRLVDLPQTSILIEGLESYLVTETPAPFAAEMILDSTRKVIERSTP